MKHLSVLVRAKLVIVRRQGRNRWNHLNAVPLREVFRRWVGESQSIWADALGRLRDDAEERE
jgi:DNA-binding transcriptional ArsR family regulator